MASFASGVVVLWDQCGLPESPSTDRPAPASTAVLCYHDGLAGSRRTDSRSPPIWTVPERTAVVPQAARATLAPSARIPSFLRTLLLVVVVRSLVAISFLLGEMART